MTTNLQIDESKLKSLNPVKVSTIQSPIMTILTISKHLGVTRSGLYLWIQTGQMQFGDDELTYKAVPTRMFIDWLTQHDLLIDDTKNGLQNVNVLNEYTFEIIKYQLINRLGDFLNKSDKTVQTLLTRTCHNYQLNLKLIKTILKMELTNQPNDYLLNRSDWSYADIKSLSSFLSIPITTLDYLFCDDNQSNLSND